MISENFIYLALVLNLFGSIGYAISTIKGKTKPNRVTWFMWGAIPLIAFFAQLEEKVGIQALFTLAVGFGPLLIFIASFLNKKAFWKISRFDVICGIISILALIFWLVTGEGLIAIALSIAADFIAGLPTLLKAYRFPETENSVVFRNGIIAGVITLLTIDNFVFAEYAFALYILVICLILYLLIRFKIGLYLKTKIA